MRKHEVSRMTILRLYAETAILRMPSASASPRQAALATTARTLPAAPESLEPPAATQEQQRRTGRASNGARVRDERLFQRDNALWESPASSTALNDDLHCDDTQHSSPEWHWLAVKRREVFLR